MLPDIVGEADGGDDAAKEAREDDLVVTVREPGGEVERYGLGDAAVEGEF